MKLSSGEIELVALNRFNWESVLQLHPAEEQEGNMPEILFSIAQSKFENCTPFGIYSYGEIKGFLMYCIFQQVAWVNRILVDKKFQREGIAGAALNLIIQHLRSRPDVREIRASMASANEAAIRLFTRSGFSAIGDDDKVEIVMRWKG